MSGGKELDVPAGRMAIPLMRHQRLALAWMLHRERSAANPRGGVLADDQGLGKTISTIALIVTNQPGDDVADEGFEDLDDEEQAHAEADAGSHDAASAHADAAPARIDLVHSATTADTAVSGGSLTDALPTVTPSLPCAEPPDRSGRALASGVLDGRQPTSDSTAQPLQLPAHPGCSVNGMNRASPDVCQSAVSGRQAVKANQAGSQNPSVMGQRQCSESTVALPAGGTLIVCPTAVLSQWARELESKVAPPAGKPPRL